ncbi:MAG: sulfatase [Opitutaceae bacterium]|jgi:arylsulfatase A-like enzyme|nr:sulfatase [Opitutaceae bacterium]
MRTRPNILWISFEDSPPWYGCYRHPVARTPCLDTLASQGALWTRAFSTAGVCAPARSAIITGMYAISIGAHHMRTTHDDPDVAGLPGPYEAVPPPHVKCFSEYMRAAGYFCSNNYKTDYQFSPPFTAWDEQGDHAHWRNRPSPETPFFAVFNLEDTHESGAWPEKCPLPAFTPEQVEVPAWLPDTPKVRETLARIHTHIENNDRRLGALLRQLDEDGLSDNTLVFHWSDHAPLPRGKRWPYDSGIHVPMIVRWPGHLRPGTRRDELVSTIDLAPTTLSLCGLPVPAHFQGRAFLGPEAEKTPPRAFVFASRDRNGTAWDRVRAARDHRFKYIRNYHPELPRAPWISFLNRHPVMQEIWRLHLRGELPPLLSQLFEYPRPPEELYDTLADPAELHNLAGSPPFHHDLQRLRRATDAWLAEVGDMGAVPESEMLARWWPDGCQPRTHAPVVIPVYENNLQALPLKDGATLPPPAASDGNACLQLHTTTQGASIAWTLEEGDTPRWHLYTTPVPFPANARRLRAKAIRIGYKESPETRIILSPGENNKMA